MYSLVRNKCVDYLRHEAAKARYADFYMYMYNESGEDDTYEEMEQQISQMYCMLDKFTPKTRTILEMCYFQRKLIVRQPVNLALASVPYENTSLTL